MDKAAENNLKSQKMRTTPVGKLLFVMSVPAILSMLVQALYNVVDSIFVGKALGDAGITALSIAMPFQLLIVAFGVGIGVGANARIAKYLGEGRQDKASATAKTAVLLALVSSVLFVVLGFTVVKPFIAAFSSDPQVVKLGVDYLSVCAIFSFGAIIELTCSKILQATGNMLFPMLSQLIGAVVNIIVDPLLIFGVGFFPAMGAKGAAVATVLGQIVSMSFIFCVLVLKKHDVSMSPKGFRLKKEFLLGICAVGLPAMVMNAMASFTTIIMNTIVGRYEGGIAILGVYFKLQSFVFMPVFGLTQGAMPILSYNYGSKNKARFVRTFWYAIAAALVIMTAGMIVFLAAPNALMRLFSVGEALMQNGAHALRIICVCFLPAAFGIVMTTMLQALGKGFTSLCMSLLRQLIFLVPLGLLCAYLFGMAGVWWCYPVAEYLVFAIFLPVALVTVKKRFIFAHEREVSMPLRQAADSGIYADETASAPVAQPTAAAERSAFCPDGAHSLPAVETVLLDGGEVCAQQAAEQSSELTKTKK